MYRVDFLSIGNGGSYFTKGLCFCLYIYIYLSASNNGIQNKER